MMIYLIFFLPILLSIGLDWLIYRRIKHSYPDKPWARLYLGQAVIVDAVIAIGLLYYKFSEAESVSTSIAIGWSIALLFLSLYPKLLYVLLSLLDYPLSWLRRRRTRWFSWAGVAAGALLFGIILWGATEGRSRIRVTEVEIPSERLPEAFDGYRVALVTDIHLGNYAHGNTLVERIVTRVNALEPDLIVNAGDLVNLSANELTPAYQEILSGLRAKDGVYSVFGNHDLGGYSRQEMTPAENTALLAEREKRMGWKMLTNQTAYVHRGADSISVSGVNYPVSTTGRLNKHLTGQEGCNLEETYRDVPQGLFNLTIAHTPQSWDEILAQGTADLTLSGHVHAMQIKIPVGERGWSPAGWMYDRWSGLYEEDGKYLYINDGIGYAMLPMRIGTRPEITLITLRSIKR